MNNFKNKNLTPNAQTLRKNMTRQERHLWYDFLKSLPITFHRQKVIGNYIVDFYCAQHKLIIELDGSQHFKTENIKKDDERTAFLQSYGLKIIRIPNNEINRNFTGVCQFIDLEVKQSLSQLC